MKVRLYEIILNFGLVLLALACGCDLLFLLALVLWMNLLLFSIRNLGERGMLFAFLIAFFVFLMGRDFLEQFFSYKIEEFPEDAQLHTYFCLCLSLLSILIGYRFFSRYRFKKAAREYCGPKQNPEAKQVSLYVFCFSWLFAVANNIITAVYVSKVGYLGRYMDFGEYLTGNPVLYVTSRMGDVMPAALSIFMASMPSKKEFKVPLICYGIYLLTSLGGGARSTFVLGLLWLLVYFLYRQKLTPEEKWFKRSYVRLGIIMLPVLAVFFSAYTYWRMGTDASDFTLVSGFVDFFYDQGVTSTVVKRAYMYSENVPKQIYLLEFLHNGVLPRILGIPVYRGNTVERALHGGSFTHSISYTVLGAAYLAGQGTGSSYIAELYYDLGYVGVCLGNLFYAFILERVNKANVKSGTFITAIKLYIVTQILWAPRASCVGFLSNLCSFACILCFVFVFGLTVLMKHRRKSIDLQVIRSREKCSDAKT